MIDTNHAPFIWSIAESLRGPFKPNEYGHVVLPFTVLRRMDAVLEETKSAVLEAVQKNTATGLPLDVLLPKVTGHNFYNTSPFTLKTLIGDSEGLRENLVSYINAFSPNVRDIFERFELFTTIAKLDEKEKLFPVTSKFANLDIHPSRVSNIAMGNMFEELIRRFSEASNETAGDHFTPREVVQLMVNLVFYPEQDILNKPGITRSIYDPTCGTGGMLSGAEEYLRSMNPNIDVTLSGQDLNDFSYAICKADMIIKGQDANNIKLGNTLTNDQFGGTRFDYGLANPPFGVNWKDDQKPIKDEHTQLGFNGRFGAGTPRVSDGAMLFLQHLIAKLRKPVDGGGRMAMVLNGSPLFTGDAGSGESNIRKWIIENDLLEAIVALPTDMFYNTGIATYIWIIDNDKSDERKGKVQLIDGSGFWEKTRKSLGSKRKTLSKQNIQDITELYINFAETEHSRIFSNSDFGYTTITVEQPLRQNDDPEGEIVRDSKGRPKPDTSLRDTENVPLTEDIESYVEREIAPHLKDFWVDRSKDKVGYEIPFTRHFYQYVPPRSLEEIDADLNVLIDEIAELLKEVER